MSNGERKQPGAPQGAAPRRNIFQRDPVIERFLKSRNELSERQRKAVELLLRGLSDQEVANQLGVDRGTVLRWRSKSVGFGRELDRQRRRLWEQSAAEIQSMVGPALSILRKQLASDDERTALRAAGVLLRFATPSRLAPAGMASPSPDDDAKAAARSNKQYVDDLIAYCEAPLPGQPGAPEDMTDDDVDEDDVEKDEEDEEA
jgi:hypothetical protein